MGIEPCRGKTVEAANRRDAGKSGAGVENLEAQAGTLPTLKEAGVEEVFGCTEYAFDAVNLPALSDASLSWDTSQLRTTGVVTVVPEPGIFTLLGIAAGCLFARRKR